MSSDEDSSQSSQSTSYHSDQSEEEEDSRSEEEEDEELGVDDDDMQDEELLYEASFPVASIEDEDIENLYSRIPKDQRVDNSIKMPPVSDQHLKLINHMKQNELIKSNRIYELMKSVDFEWFYKQYPNDWPATNANLLEMAHKVVNEGDDIMSFPLNMYFNVCMALYVGYKGSVLCFGHSVNINMLKRSGLEWLETDDRLRFTYETLNASFGSCYSEFIEEGFPLRMPYDVILLATLQPVDSNGELVVSSAVAKQLKPNGICYQPCSDLIIEVMRSQDESDSSQLEKIKDESLSQPEPMVQSAAFTERAEKPEATTESSSPPTQQQNQDPSPQLTQKVIEIKTEPGFKEEPIPFTASGSDHMQCP